MLSKFINLIKPRQHTIFLAICLILIAIISYNLGLANSRAKLPMKITGQNNVYKASAVDVVAKSKIGDSQKVISSPIVRDPRVVASKNSTTKKYHFTWCPSAKKIKEENKLWFDNEETAIKAGYALAGNCTK